MNRSSRRTGGAGKDAGSIRTNYVALSGGIGGAKLALGLSMVLDPDALLVIANTGDDFEHLGLYICPDLDTLTYTLAGLGNPETGWGLADETWTFMAGLSALGGETWFSLGDRDLATHVERTRRLSAGESLTAISADFCTRLGISIRIAPMSDEPVRTVVETADGPLPFQDYFVRDKAVPAVSAFRFEGADEARANPVLMNALADPALGAVLICPSNPFISIDPILSLPGLRAALARCAAPVVAVSPIVGNDAVKGPTAKMMRELGMRCSAETVARYYADILDGFVLDSVDAPLADAVRGLDQHVLVTSTVMRSLDDRVALARAVLDFAANLTAKADVRP